jgi:hypothetical protein
MALVVTLCNVLFASEEVIMKITRDYEPCILVQRSERYRTAGGEVLKTAIVLLLKNKTNDLKFSIETN